MTMTIPSGTVPPRVRKRDPHTLLRRLYAESIKEEGGVFNFFAALFSGVDGKSLARGIEAAYDKTQLFPSQMLLVVAMHYKEYRRNAILDMDPKELNEVQYGNFIQCFTALSNEDLITIAEERRQYRDIIWSVIAMQGEYRFETMTAEHLIRLDTMDPMWSHKVWIRKARDWSVDYEIRT